MSERTLLDEADVQEYVNLPTNVFKDCGKNTVIFIADGGNHFTHYGIVEGMFLFFDPDKPFKEGHLSCFMNYRNEEPKLGFLRSPSTAMFILAE